MLQNTYFIFSWIGCNNLTLPSAVSNKILVDRLFHSMVELMCIEAYKELILSFSFLKIIQSIQCILQLRRLCEYVQYKYRQCGQTVVRGFPTKDSLLCGWHLHTVATHTHQEGPWLLLGPGDCDSGGIVDSCGSSVCCC